MYRCTFANEINLLQDKQGQAYTCNDNMCGVCSCVWVRTTLVPPGHPVARLAHSHSVQQGV
jgi:hypothetical protein